ncbi:MAG TPA: hypothetical protein VME21_03420 [Steroidobacteraceae bacterium]|nr:hypothetical protein [Steroidobacteraceae bacterium]
MRQLVLVLPDAHLAEATLAHASAQLPLPGLAQLARFADSVPLAQHWRAWLASWSARAELSVVAPAVIAAICVPQVHAARPPSVWFAQPLHWVATLTRVHLPPEGLLRLDAQSRHGLTAAFNEAFGPQGYTLLSLGSGGLLLLAPAFGAVDSTDPLQAVTAGDLGQALPQGAGAAALRRLGAEIEMWLHQHPLNQARERAGALPIGALWLWGGGDWRVLPPAPRRDGVRSFYSADPYVEGLASLAGASHAAPPSGLGALAGSTAPTGRICVLPPRLSADEAREPAAALAALERHWITPAVDAVARGHIGELTIVTARRVSTLRSHSRLKLWRRSREPLAALR